tara:strand:+ start:1607 stop:2098 length:492 start_codon:yes stop_codon:yes gene_type:complete
VKDNSIENKLDLPCSRRKFVLDALTGIGTVSIGSFIIVNQAACSSDANPVSPNGQGLSFMVDMSLSENSALQVVGGTIALPSNPIDSHGMLLYRKSEDIMKVYSRNCTHANCTIDAYSSSGVSLCSCHGSRFDLNGNVIDGPAEDPLKQYNATISGNIVTINS